MAFLTFIRDSGLDLQTTEIFLLNDLGSELCIEKRKGKKKTPHREGGRRLDGAVLAQALKTHRDRDREGESGGERERETGTETKTEAANSKNEAESMQVREKKQNQSS